jgi:YD repeat-containing protein
VEHSGSLSGQTGWTQNYGYVDGGGGNGQYGNLQVTGTTMISSGMTCESYDASTNRCADVGYGYTDGRGNTTSYPGSRTAAYDGENRQQTLTDDAMWQYGYDGEGRRVTKTGGGSSVTYAYNARGELAAEYDGTVDTSGCTPCYVTVDHLGSTRMVTNESGGVWRRYAVRVRDRVRVERAERGGGVPESAGRDGTEVHRQGTGCGDGPRLL